MSTRLLSLLFIASVFVPSCTPAPHVPDLETVAFVDVQRYMGKWYEIASYPTFFNATCAATTAEYTLRDDGTVRVVNECRIGDPSGRLNRIEGTARVVDEQTNAKLIVSFSLFAQGDYWIIDLDEDYQWAVVGDPKRSTLFILSRTPTLDDEIYDGILGRLSEKCYDPEYLRLTIQATSESD
ncbi:MAG: lipocalin family protein [Phycisphaerae bacterium]|nr:lipocalin family protein [Phycisphaerae bacterium]